MLVPNVVTLLLGVVVVMSPSSLLESLGTSTDWELELARLTGAFLLIHGLITLSASHVPGVGYGDVALNRSLNVALVAAGIYLIRGDGLFLLVTFCLVVGVSLNRAMKRLELAYERAQSGRHK